MKAGKYVFEDATGSIVREVDADGMWEYVRGGEYRASGTPNSGTAKERTMLHAIETGKIQAGEAGLRGLRKELEKIFGMEVDISIIEIDGPFDNPPFIPIK